MSYDTELEQQALTLPRGVWSSGLDCPACGGKRCLGIFADNGGYKYRCHRAECDVGGSTSRYMGVAESRIVRPPDPYSGPLTDLPEGILALLAKDYHISTVLAKRYIKDAQCGWFGLPVIGPNGVIRGYNIRYPWGIGAPPDGLPKSKLYMNNPQSLAMAWYGQAGCGLDDPPGAAQALLVEDQLSALCVYGQWGARAVALLGVTLNAEKVRELQQNGIKDVVLALDADATAEAFKIAAHWGPAFRSFKVGILDRDLKDMDLPSIGRFLDTHDLWSEEFE